eukprot:TRINITY_DN784_c0_g2_i4.p1 TRINITY_DN784_c0_g2~~TRINITY_DN784_c0_g2_i4.p1  ORF type:complete len:284 (-),score=93.09 TRINITY_DN784_c0_g2_i4:152-1003(-)
MGLAIRSKNLLPLNFPSIIWKQLCHQPVTLHDVKDIDLFTYHLLQDLHNPELTPTTFEYTIPELTFEVMTCDHHRVPLVERGASRAVTFANRTQFAQALLNFRVHEFDEVCQALRQGLYSVVSAPLFVALTWQELEQQVCGAGINLDLLERQTTYESCSRADRHIGFFWDMMRNRFDDATRAKFLTFVWGRSRLPTSADTWGSRQFKIQSMSLQSGYRTIDQMLPITHTCFFSIELPAYSSVDIMTERVTYAMNSCGAIDGDGSSDHGTIETNIESDGEFDDE